MCADQVMNNGVLTLVVVALVVVLLLLIMVPLARSRVPFGGSSWSVSETTTVNGRPATAEEKVLIDQAFEEAGKAMDQARVAMDEAFKKFDEIGRAAAKGKG